MLDSEGIKVKEIVDGKLYEDTQEFKKHLKSKREKTKLWLNGHIEKRLSKNPSLNIERLFSDFTFGEVVGFLQLVKIKWIKKIFSKNTDKREIIEILENVCEPRNKIAHHNIILSNNEIWLSRRRVSIADLVDSLAKITGADYKALLLVKIEKHRLNIDKKYVEDNFSKNNLEDLYKSTKLIRGQRTFNSNLIQPPTNVGGFLISNIIILVEEVIRKRENMKNKENLTQSQIDKEIDKLNKKIDINNKIKIGSTNFKTLKEYEDGLAKIKRDDMIFRVQRFISKEHGNITMTAAVLDAEVSWTTFKKYVKCYKKTGDLPVNGNKGKVPWNKTTESKILKVVNITTKIINQVEKFAGEPVPTLVPLLYKNVLKEVNVKNPNIKISLSTFKRIIKDGSVDVKLKYEARLGKNCVRD